MSYVNNKDLYKEICKWKQACYEAGEQVKIPDTIGEAIMLISDGLTKRYNFSGYTPAWKQEMYWDGIEASVKGLINFDETKYNNPHAYITQACFNAFVQRIKKEQKEMAIKYSYFVHNVYDSYDEEMTNIADEPFIQDIYNKLTTYEQSKRPEKIEVPVPEGPTLDYLYDDED
ncbi:RNA polymerase sigma factor for late transcription [Providencia phage PSTRCR_127]|nr:RNA polymerase sigma factor for late transcription [Providencia phage PSTRCR_127]QQV88926.1 RNA polymerase sigma factor for late transcription [Providencia phage PSTRCR_121]UGO50088.1 putative sigma factor for late transcription [Morganella phage vB_MmoM_Rgz1]